MAAWEFLTGVIIPRVRSASCSASLAFSFVFSRSSEAWNEVFHKKDPEKLPVSLIPALCGPLYSKVFL